MGYQLSGPLDCICKHESNPAGERLPFAHLGSSALPLRAYCFFVLRISENYISRHNELDINAMIPQTSRLYFLV